LNDRQRCLLHSNQKETLINTIKWIKSHEDVQELEDALVSQDVEDVPRRRVDDRQPVNLILQQGVDGVKQTEGTKLTIKAGMRTRVEVVLASEAPLVV